MVEAAVGRRRSARPGVPREALARQALLETADGQRLTRAGFLRWQARVVGGRRAVPGVKLSSKRRRCHQASVKSIAALIARNLDSEPSQGSDNELSTEFRYRSGRLTDTSRTSPAPSI